MTNPPFYSSETEMLGSAKAKKRPPNSACTGAPVEMIYPGGEVAFVNRLVAESMLPEMRKRVQWCTSMLGKLVSVGMIVETLKEKECHNWAVTEFVQGQKTRRWAVGWSWSGKRPRVEVARGIPGLERRFLPFPSEFSFEVDGLGSIDRVGEKIDQEIKGLDLRWQWKASIAQGLGMTWRDVWSRKARRKKAVEEELEEEEEPSLVFKVSLAVEGARPGIRVAVRWLQGTDSVLFESLCGWLKRKTENR